MVKRTVRVGGYVRSPETVRTHVRRGTKVKSYRQKRRVSRRNK